MALSRRGFLASSLLALGGAARAQPPARPRVAAIYTVLRHRSHAQNILENFLQPYLFNGRVVDPGMDVVSMYADQRVEEGDRTDEVSKRFKVPVYRTIREALVRGGKELACDAVLLIGEHGEYPVNKLGQMEYPRKRFFDEIVAVMQESRRFAPIFNDKHLAYRWDWSNEMFDTARKHQIPFMAGSSVPLAQRVPPLEVPADADIEEIVSVHGGNVESYDFHAYEVLQSLVEARKGGETGIASVEFLTGDAMWRAAQAGRWSPDLARHALAAEFGEKVPNLREPLQSEKPVDTHVVLLTYKDGLKGTVLKFGQNSNRWNVALKLKGEMRPRHTKFRNGPWGNRNLFMALSHAIQSFFRTRESPYPLERTLFASGVVDATMHSRAEGKPIATPHLEMRYAVKDFRAFRETGASWTIVEKRAEDKNFHTLGK